MNQDSRLAEIALSPFSQRKLWWTDGGVLPDLVTGYWSSLWNTSGDQSAPGWGSAHTTDILILTSASAGAHSLAAPPSPPTDPAFEAAQTYRQYLASINSGLVLPVGVSGILTLYDRVAMTSPLAPASGAYAGPWVGATTVTRPVGGAGLELWAEVATGTNAAAHTVTVAYKDAANATKSAIITLPVSLPIARMIPAVMDATSTAGGIRQITGISGTATPPTGTFNLVILRRLASFIVNAGIPVGLPLGPEVLGAPAVDSACITMMFFSLTATDITNIYLDTRIAQIRHGLE